jgi:signal transduction histidine kinase
MAMKKNSSIKATMKHNGPVSAEVHANGRASTTSSELCVLLAGLQAMRDGDFSVRLPSDWTGLDGQIADTFNTIMAANQAIAQELKRVGQVVGQEGKTQERVRFDQSQGAWGEMEASVNTLVDDLLRPTTEVTRAIAAVAQGDLTQPVRLDVDGRPLEGEFLWSAMIVNTMIRQLGAFTAEVIRLAREVGTDGKLDSQADSPGVAGTWKDLIHTIIDHLRHTAERHAEQEWLKTHLARCTDMLQDQRDLATVGQMLLSELTPLVNAQQGVIYQVETGESPGLKLLSTFAADGLTRHRQSLKIGEGLIGQCVVEKRRMLLTDLPSHTVPIHPGQVQTGPQHIIVLPVLCEDQVKAVLELASLSPFTTLHLAFLEQLTARIGVVFHCIEAAMQTEALLHQSQQLVADLQTRQQALQQANERLAQKAQQLAKQNVKTARKHRKVAQALRTLEAQAAELALTSKYKSEFLANMSHELRTPLNSILVLSQQLGDNSDGNLTPRQVRFAYTIHGAGTDLLHLINDILDLSKIESGTVTVEAEEVCFATLLETVARPFRHEAEHRQLIFDVHTEPRLGRSLVTDAKRLQQVLKNLLSNAFKFTERGGVRLCVSTATDGWSTDHPILTGAPAVVAFEVADTGIGIPCDKHRLIFEAFQQADASISRKYGGTGLGLAISRELATLLGGEIQVRSIPGMGSIFTLYLPQTYVSPSASKGVMTDGITAPPPLGACPAEPVVLADLPLEQQRMLDQLPCADDDFVGQKVLVVDDDVRNIFALSGVLERHGMTVLTASTGREALATLHAVPDLAIVLLDMIMPETDGYETMQVMRQNALFQRLPIIALTAKAMPGDREKCLQAGASDYLAKPINTEQLLSALRMWLRR